MNKCFEPHADIPLPPDVDKIQELVDDHQERWLFVRTKRHMEIWNVTSTPRLHYTVPIPRDTSVFVTTNGHVLVNEMGSLRFDLYSFKYPDYQLCLLQAKDFSELVGIENDYDMFLMGNVFVLFIEELFMNCLEGTPCLWILHLSPPYELTPICFSAEIIAEFKSFCGFGGDEDSRTVCNFALEGQGTSIIVKLRFELWTQIMIFNLENRTFTHIVGQLKGEERKYFNSCHMYGNKVCCIKGTDQQMILSINTDSSSNSLSRGQLLMGPFNCPKALFKGPKIISVQGQEVKIISLDSDELCEKQMRIDEGWGVINFIEPKFLLIGKRDLYTSVKMINVMNGEEMYTWDKCYYSYVYSDYYMKQVYPSRLGLVYHNGISEKLRLFSL